MSSSLEWELDSPPGDLEMQWRQAHEAMLAARSHHETVCERVRAAANLLEKARDRLDILEILEARALAALQAQRAGGKDRPKVA